MKKILFYFLVIYLSSNQSFSQKLVEDKTDDFTGHKVKRTSWSLISMTANFTGHFRISSINDNLYYDLKLMNNSAFSIDEGGLLLFKLANDSIVQLKNLRFAITGFGDGAVNINGCNALGISTTYIMSQSQAEILKNNIVTKFRVYTNDGYLECDYKPERYEKLKTSLNLVE